MYFKKLLMLYRTPLIKKKAIRVSNPTGFFSIKKILDIVSSKYEKKKK